MVIEGQIISNSNPMGTWLEVVFITTTETRNILVKHSEADHPIGLEGVAGAEIIFVAWVDVHITHLTVGRGEIHLITTVSSSKAHQAMVATIIFLQIEEVATTTMAHIRLQQMTHAGSRQQRIGQNLLLMA